MNPHDPNIPNLPEGFLVAVPKGFEIDTTETTERLRWLEGQLKATEESRDRLTSVARNALDALDKRHRKTIAQLQAERDKWKSLADLKDAKGEANRNENNILRGMISGALSQLETIRTEKLSARGLPDEASAISKARVFLDRSLRPSDPNSPTYDPPYSMTGGNS